MASALAQLGQDLLDLLIEVRFGFHVNHWPGWLTAQWPQLVVSTRVHCAGLVALCVTHGGYVKQESVATTADLGMLLCICTLTSVLAGCVPAAAKSTTRMPWVQ